MAQKTAVVRGELPFTSVGETLDLTSSGLGTVSAAIIIACNATASANPSTTSAMNIGLWDGTNQRASCYRDGDNQATSVCKSSSITTRGIKFLTSSGVSHEFSVSSITDGIRLTLDVNTSGSARYVTVFLISGISAKLITFTPNATVDTTTESASIGFAPKAVLFTTIGHTVADSGTVANSLLSFGIARQSDGRHRMIATGANDAAGTSIVYKLFSETRCVGQVYNDALVWAGEITTWGSDTFTMTTRTAGSGSDVCFALVLGGDVDIDCGTLTTKTTTGTEAVTTTHKPASVMIVSSSATSTTIETSTDADGWCIGFSNGTNHYAHNSTNGDNLNTTNVQSEASATKIIDLDLESAGFTALVEASVDSFNATNFTLNYTTANATARKGWWLSFGAPATKLPAPVHINQSVMHASNY